MTEFDRLLLAAFEAGAAWERDSRTSFGEWRESISALEREPDLGPVRTGDLIEIVSADSRDREIRGLRFVVARAGSQSYYFVHDGAGWYVPHHGAKKVQP